MAKRTNAQDETEDSWTEFLYAIGDLANSEGGQKLLEKISDIIEKGRQHKSGMLEKQIGYAKQLQLWDIVQIAVLFAGVIIAGISLQVNADVIAGLLGAIIGNALPKFNLFGQQQRH